MLYRSRKTLLVLFGLIMLAVLAYAAPIAARTFIPSVRQDHALEKCDGAASTDLRVECVMGVIQDELKIGGVNGGIEVFARAYRRYVDFADSGCHSWAHRVGDFTYYQLYWANQDLDDLQFPQETTACGYGFFHGFLEHDVQDHPTTAFVTETCDYLTKRLVARMSDIELICYHAGGHGFMVAHSLTLGGKSRGDISAYVTEPASQCAALPKANATDIEQCYEGIFNILVNYMEDGAYGFTYDKTHPFAICTKVSASLQKACIYEMAQKIDSASDYDAKRMIELVGAITDEDNKMMAFEVGVAGLVERSVASDGYTLAYAQCEELEEPYYTSCFTSVIWGLFEHGDPQREYEKPLQLCLEPSVAAHGKTELCYERVAQRLPRFYETPKVRSICLQFPETYRHLCEDELTER